MNESGHKPNTMPGRMLAQAVDHSVDQKSDEVLITLFQAGDEQAFRLLVERYQEKIRNLIYSIFREPSLIDDLAQEVFIKTYEALPQFRFESSFYTWLYRITVNKCRDELRKRKIRKVLSLQTLMETSDQELRDKTSVDPQHSETQELLAKGLTQLPEKFRLPVVLKDIDGLSYEEIGVVMQCGMGTVKSRLSRGRSMLRKILRPLLEES